MERIAKKILAVSENRNRLFDHLEIELENRMDAVANENSHVDVLLVEDSLGDVRLTREALHDANSSLRVHVVTDGQEAVAFLRREVPHADAPRPRLVLLDLNLPKMNGLEVLARLKGDDRLKSIPTVILSTSDTETDIVRSYQFSANCYVQKPTHYEAFQDLVRSINDFWLTTRRSAQQVLNSATSAVAAN